MIGYLTYLAVIVLIVLMIGFAKTLWSEPNGPKAHPRS